MSASKEKKTRVEQREAGTDKKRNAANEEALKAKKFKRNAIIAVVCIILVVAAAIVINSNLFYTSLTAIQVGNTKYSAAEVDVFYRNTYNNLYNSYGSLAEYIIDPNTPLTQQNYSETQTWADYISELTLDNMKQITALYDEATANGYTLTEDDQTTIDAQLASVEFYARSNNLTSDQYLTAIYGKGVNTQVFTSVLTKMIVAQSYSESVRDGYTYTAAELDAYYSAHKDELDYFDYFYYLVGTDNAAFESMDDDAKVTAAHDAAEEIIAAVTSADTAAEDFADAVAAFSEDAAPGEINYQGSQITSYYPDYGSWVMDASRAPGDVTVVDADGGSYALLFIQRDDNDYLSKNMRHILIEAEADENYEYTDEAREAALTRINEITDEWQANPTEDHFAELANDYSDDTGSNTTGGLYENIRKRQMVTNINNFLFEDGPKPGETAILFGENGGYQGYHLVYFVGDGPLYKDYLAEAALRNEDYDAWIESLSANYEVTSGSGRNYVKLG